MKNRPDTERRTNSVAHFERVIVVAKRLAEQGIDIRGHEYYPHFFGMWKIEAGSFRHRYRFMWDAREQWIHIDEAFFGELGSLEGAWKELNVVTIDARKGADPFKYVEDFFAEGGSYSSGFWDKRMACRSNSQSPLPLPEGLSAGAGRPAAVRLTKTCVGRRDG